MRDGKGQADNRMRSAWCFRPLGSAMRARMGRECKGKVDGVQVVPSANETSVTLGVNTKRREFFSRRFRFSAILADIRIGCRRVHTNPDRERATSFVNYFFFGAAFFEAFEVGVVRPWRWTSNIMNTGPSQETSHATWPATFLRSRVQGQARS